MVAPFTVSSRDLGRVVDDDLNLNGFHLGGKWDVGLAQLGFTLERPAAPRSSSGAEF